MVENLTRSFHYPAMNGETERRMCTAGQRIAASEGWDLLNEGGEEGKDRTLKRAASAELALTHGADTNKHNLISYVVLQAFINGVLEE